MGRRKIEIQPITVSRHRERQASFLRKTGLFKKAYELGVLCSVEVAVIIFEERPGHHVKLYQYSSTNVHDVIQRHLQFDGEKDSRGPMDFVNAAPSKPDEDDEDSEMVNTDTLQGSVPGKRSIDGTIKSRYHASKSSSEGTDMSKPGLEYHLDRGQVVPMQSSPVPAHPPVSGAASTSSLPISGERDSSLRAPPAGTISTHKKLRFGDVEAVPSRQGLDQRNTTSQNSNVAYSYSSPPALSAFGHSQPSPAYQPFLRVASHQHLGFEHPISPRAPAPQTRSSGYSTPTSFDSNRRSAIYPSIGRQQSQQFPSATTQSSSNTDILTAFLDPEDRRLQSGLKQAFGTADWPSNAHPMPTSQASAAPVSSSQDTGWLDYISNTSNPPAPSGGQLSAPLSSSHRSRAAMSAERNRTDAHTYSLEREGHASSSTIVASPPDARKASSMADHRMDESASKRDSRIGDNDKRTRLDLKREDDL